MTSPLLSSKKRKEMVLKTEDTNHIFPHSTSHLACRSTNWIRCRINCVEFATSQPPDFTLGPSLAKGVNRSSAGRVTTNPWSRSARTTTDVKSTRRTAPLVKLVDFVNACWWACPSRDRDMADGQTGSKSTVWCNSRLMVDRLAHMRGPAVVCLRYYPPPCTRQCPWLHLPLPHPHQGCGDPRNPHPVQDPPSLSPRDSLKRVYRDQVVPALVHLRLLSLQRGTWASF